MIGIGSLICNNIILYFTFLKAYFNGHKIVITIDSYGEANFEFFFMPIFFIIGCWTSWISFKSLLNNKKD